MTTQTYISSDGDTVDFVAWKHYGTLKGQITEQVLAANPGLADYGPILPAGVTITLPDVDKVSKVEGIKLWG